MNNRATSWEIADRQVFDVLVIGGGINGTCLFSHLVRKGYKVFLVDKNDFASGTSQASGMMVWGGLLYLRKLDLRTVFQLSCDRDAMIRELKGRISPRLYRYVPSKGGDIHPRLVHAALYFYWAMGLFRRKVPRSEDSFRETYLLKPGEHKGSLLYEEGVLNASDCRFTFDWLTSVSPESSIALNYSSVAGEYSESDKCWHLAVKDQLTNKDVRVIAKLIVNCSGVWTNEVNDQFGIQTPYKHALSKGVYIGIKRPEGHDSLMIFEMGNNSDVVTFVPWGPVALWGPTETFPRDIEDGMSVAPEDVEFLLDCADRHLRSTFDKSQIVSMRCGIRPLAVKKDFSAARYPLDLSRKQHVVMDGAVPWISCYGGKITGCNEMANRVIKTIGKKVNPTCEPTDVNNGGPQKDIEWISWPGIKEKVPSPRWCARHELCCTLEDYLRRRTNISQWVPRQGLGQNNEYRDALISAAMGMDGGNREKAEIAVSLYEAGVKSQFDQVLEKV